MDGPVDFIKFLLFCEYSVDLCLEYMQPVGLKLGLYHLGLEKETIVKVCCTALKECHGPNQAPVVHRRYKQASEFKLYTSTPVISQIGAVRMGQILQLYRKDDSCQVAENILMNLKTDFTTLIDYPAHYDLRRLKHDSYLEFNSQTGVIEAGYFKNDASLRKTYVKEDWDKLTEQDHCRHWLECMRKTKR